MLINLRHGKKSQFLKTKFNPSTPIYSYRKDICKHLSEPFFPLPAQKGLHQQVSRCRFTYRRACVISPTGPNTTPALVVYNCIACNKLSWVSKVQVHCAYCRLFFLTLACICFLAHKILLPHLCLPLHKKIHHVKPTKTCRHQKTFFFQNHITFETSFDSHTWKKITFNPKLIPWRSLRKAMYRRLPTDLSTLALPWTAEKEIQQLIKFKLY